MQRGDPRLGALRPATGGLCAWLALAGCGSEGTVTEASAGTQGLTAADDESDTEHGDSEDATDTGAAGDGDAGTAADDGMDEGSDGTDDGGMLGEPCDGFDNDGDGQVDELCTCEAGDVQDCYAGPPEQAIDCRATTQTCELSGGSEQAATWGACGGLCDGTTLTLDDPAMFRIWGAAAGDRFRLAEGGHFADIDGDGEMDFSGASAAGDAASPDVGAAYGLFGGPCLQRAVLDLATLPLTGLANDDGQGGFVVDNGTSGQGTPNATMGDVDGSGFGDVLVADTSTTMSAALGTSNPPALFEAAAPDGVDAVRFTGGGGSYGTIGKGFAGDYDGDGFDDIFMSSWNNHPQCPCATSGLSVWWGADDLPATVPVGHVVPIGIGHVGQASQHNFSVVGSVGDFNNDGFLDVTGGNGAANDGMVIQYRTGVMFGNPARSFPGTMIGGDGNNGFVAQGGSGRGPHPNHQSADFDGDGIDDLLTYANVSSFQLHLIYGHTGPFPPAIDVGGLATDGLVIESTVGLVVGGMRGGNTMGFGDLDGDGFDDIVSAVSDTEAGGVVILWGRPGATGTLDLDVDPETTVIMGAPGLGITDRLAVEDLDGDGLGDLILGAPDADGLAGEDTGAGMVKFGACLAAEHNPDLMMGQDGPDILIGTAGRDTIAGGRGDDTIETGGGPDVAYGGGGDDTIVVTDLQFARVHGGLGEDTLIVDAGGELDLTTTGRARIQEIEHFDLRDGAQHLRLNAGDASALTRTRALTVDADASDSVTLVGSWQHQPGPGSYDLYVLGALSVAIESTTSVTIEP